VGLYRSAPFESATDTANAADQARAADPTKAKSMPAFVNPLPHSGQRPDRLDRADRPDWPDRSDLASTGNSGPRMSERKPEEKRA